MNIKTPIEILKELDPYDNACFTTLRAIEAIESYHSQFEDKWISVEDKPTPDFDGEYLCVIVESEDCGQTYIRQRVLQCLFNVWVVKHNQSVTHWRELPSFANPK